MILLEAMQVTNMYSLIGIFITIFGSQVGVYMKYRSDRNKDKKSRDEKQEDQISEISKQILSLTEEFGLLANEVALIIPVIKEITFEKVLTKRLSAKGMEVIKLSGDLNENLKTFLISGMRSFIGFSIHNFISDHEYKSEKYYNDVIKASTDNLKHFSRHLFSEIRFHKNEPIGFATYIYDTRHFNSIIIKFVDRLLKNELNQDKYVVLFEEYLEEFMVLVVKQWREFIELPYQRNLN